MANRRFLLACSLAAMIAAAGCSTEAPREKPPALDAAAAAQAAIDQYDTNHDGAIAGDELDQCPALKSALARFDNHGDKRATAATIAARMKQWQELGSMSVSLFVELDGQPLEGASVVYEPEKFLGPTFVEGRGTTDARGFASIRQSEKSGLPLGLYKIRISKLVAGQETIPARFNSKTTLGAEVAPTTPPTGFVTLKLTSK